jgi:hypothetical protein
VHDGAAPSWAPLAPHRAVGPRHTHHRALRHAAFHTHQACGGPDVHSNPLTNPTTEAAESRFADRDEREIAVTSDLIGALDEPGF